MAIRPNLDEIREAIRQLPAAERQQLLDEMIGDFYEPKDPEEIRVVEEVLQDDSKLLGPEEGRKYLKEQLRRHGIG